MYAKILTYPKDRSFFLFGPRSTGKSTWVQEAFPSGLFVDLLKASTFLLYGGTERYTEDQIHFIAVTDFFREAIQLFFQPK
jgi:uncharacterized protein